MQQCISSDLNEDTDQLVSMNQIIGFYNKKNGTCTYKVDIDNFHNNKRSSHQKLVRSESQTILVQMMLSQCVYRG